MHPDGDYGCRERTPPAGIEPRGILVLKGVGPLASTKWCESTVASMVKSEYIPEKKIESVPLHGVCEAKHVVRTILRASMLAHTMCIAGGVLGPPHRSLGPPPHNSMRLSQIRKRSEVLDSATPK